MNQLDACACRRNTGSLKWDGELVGGAVPYWVADMDFKSPECIMRALHERVEHGVFGYAVEPPGFRELLVGYMKESHEADISPEWIVHILGCVPALAMAAVAYCGPGDSMMTCSPVYPPIRNVHAGAGAALIEVPHIRKDGLLAFDWEGMEAAVRPDTKMFILCNPQNPMGRVFNRDELLLLADFCERHDLILCSDEIHCDLILEPGVKHVPAVSLPERYWNRIVSLTAPSKTYNIAGIGYSFVLIPSEELRCKFITAKERFQPPLHCLAFASAGAAYSEGEPWRLELIKYLRENRDALYEFVQDKLPGVVIYPMEATYLAWMDCSALKLGNPQKFFHEKAGVYLNSGEPFGNCQCVRFNFGTTREQMLEGLEKMAAALKSR